MVHFRRDLVELSFSSMDTIPEQFRIFVEELLKIQEGNIDPIAFNKHKKDVNTLLASWIELASGMLFERKLFHFQEDFERYANALHQEIRKLEKFKNKEKQIPKIQLKTKKILEVLMQYQKKPIIELFKETLNDEKIIKKEFEERKKRQKKLEEKQGNIKKQDPWKEVKKRLNITKAFEELVLFEDDLLERRAKEEELMKELYTMDSNGELIPKSYLKMEIPIDPNLDPHYRK